jgi:hypothetical protein
MTPLKTQAAAQIARFVSQWKGGITTQELFSEYKEIFPTEHGFRVTQKEGVDMIQKQLAKLYQQGLVRFSERVGKGPRTYFPTKALLDEFAPKPTQPTQPAMIETKQAIPESQPAPATSYEDEAPTGSVKACFDQTPQGASKIAFTQESEGAAKLALTKGLDAKKIADDFHDSTIALANLLRWQDEQLRTRPAPMQNPMEVLLALELSAAMLEPIRPDLAKALTQAQAYFETSRV